MQSWIEGFQQSIDFIEKNLASSLEIEDIAQIAALSPFYYQRIFGALCGMTVGEYIRARRMTMAALELSSTDEKVIDVAMKYGYDIPRTVLQRRSSDFTVSRHQKLVRPVRHFDH